ncbi:MAG: hypothetical protein ACOX0D_08445 [Sphaerochaeta sp.]
MALAEKGMVLNVIADDAYFGLFFEDDVAKESIFAKLCAAHERISGDQERRGDEGSDGVGVQDRLSSPTARKGLPTDSTMR